MGVMRDILIVDTRCDKAGTFVRYRPFGHPKGVIAS
jgi:hypothetical protein